MDKHINTAEAAKGTGAPLIAARDAETAEDKTPACTIRFEAKSHPFTPGAHLVYVRGSWADGAYGPFPHTSDGLAFNAPADKATNARAGRLREFRAGGGYFTYAGHYSLGYVIQVGAEHLDNTLAWLAQAKMAFESRIPQTPKPAKVGVSKAKAAAPVDF